MCVVISEIPERGGPVHFGVLLKGGVSDHFVSSLGPSFSRNNFSSLDLVSREMISRGREWGEGREQHK